MNKTEQLIDAIDHPEKYSDEEVRALLSDPEVREAYDTMCSMKAALSAQPESDLDIEWQSFAKREYLSLSPQDSLNNQYSYSSEGVEGKGVSDKTKGFFRVKRKYTKMLLRNSAAVVTVCILSAAAIATVIGVKLHERQATPISYSGENTELVQAATVITEQDTATIEPATAGKYEPVLFENTSLEEILNTMKGRYEVEVIFKSPETKSLRLYFNWNPELPVTEIVELLNNFQQFSIRLSDNTLIVE